MNLKIEEEKLVPGGFSSFVSTIQNGHISGIYTYCNAD